MQHKLFKQSDGQSLSYLSCGDGPFVLLIHGLTMWSDMWYLNGVIEALSAETKLIVPDLRGHGKSSKPHDPALYGMNLVFDLVSILENEGEADAHVIGFSTGAELALKLATIAPNRVVSLLLIGSGWSGADVMPLYRELAVWGRQTGESMTPEPDYDALDALVEAMPNVIDVTRDDIERLSIPSAGIVGSDDPQLPNLEKLVGVLLGFELEILPGQPHETSWRDPSIPTRIRDFVKMASRNYDLRK